MKEIDCRGLFYLKIIREIKGYFNLIGEGEVIVIVDSDFGKFNVIRYILYKGYYVE